MRGHCALSLVLLYRSQTEIVKVKILFVAVALFLAVAVVVIVVVAVVLVAARRVYAGVLVFIRRAPPRTPQTPRPSSRKQAKTIPDFSTFSHHLPSVRKSWKTVFLVGLIKTADPNGKPFFLHSIPYNLAVVYTYRQNFLQIIAYILPHA
jgi:hypothetical protein